MSLRNLIIVMNVVAGAFLVGVAWASLRARRARVVTAPNLTPYYGDEVMEGPRLERMLGFALVLFAVIAAALPIYWLVEPTRQQAMQNRFHATSVKRGAELFAPVGSNLVALGCADCHGPRGEGGATVQNVTIDKSEVLVKPGALDNPDRICAPLPDKPDKLLCRVIWKVPALNTVFLRFSREKIIQIVTYGRPNTPMPAWGLAGGGAKNEQSIENIVDYVESLQIPEAQAKAQQANLTDGRQLFEANCARCHTKQWSYKDTPGFQNGDVNLVMVPGGGAFGPNLTNGDVVRQFPEEKDQIDFITNGSDFQKAYGTRGIGSGRMPGFGRMLTPEQIKAIADYERSLDGKPVDAKGNPIPPSRGSSG